MDIQLKKKDESDDEFLFQLFGEIKIAELNIYAWPEQMKNQLVSMQYNAYETMIKNEYPNAADYIIVCNSKKAGRLQLESNEHSIRIINISLLPAFQGKGIGSTILKDILEEANQKQVPVYLEVDKTNPALFLYQRLGFEIYGQNEVKYSMKYIQKKFLENFTQ